MLTPVLSLLGAAFAILVSAQQAAFDFRDLSATTGGARANLRHVVNTTVSTRSLASVTSQDELTVLEHPRFPAYQVRMKKSEFCDPTVKCA